MTKIYKYDVPPENSLIKKDFGIIHHCDSYMLICHKEQSIDSLVTEVFRVPFWVEVLMRIRDSIVHIFGLKTGKSKNINALNDYPIGSKAIYFTVIDRNNDEIVMAENDKHLNFRTSLLKMQNGQGSAIYLTTIVQFNNFGVESILHLLKYSTG